MRNYIAVVFNDSPKAYEGLHALWDLDHSEEITVHGAAVIHRDDLGEIHVDTKETHPVLGTAVGVGIGALLGALAGPAGAAAGAAGGAAATAAVGAAIGASAGGLVGGAVDMERADTRDQAGRETRFVLADGQSAVIAEVSEDWTSPIDTRMSNLGGVVYRRAKSEVEDDAWYDEYYIPSYLYPYEYVPSGYMFP